MHSGSDMGGPGFSSRRPNASSLSSFALPPPPLDSKYTFAVSGAGQAGNHASVGSLLTPPSTVATEVSQSVSSSSAPPASSYSNGGYTSWSPSQPTHTNYYPQSGTTQSFSQASRVSYSPASNIVRGQPHSPPSSEGGQMANYDLPPFPSSAPLTPATLPSMGPQQSQAHQQQQAMQNQMLGSSTPTTTQPSPVQHQDAFRAPPTPTFYSGQSTPQTATFPYSTGAPSQVTPLSVSGSMPGRAQISPATTGPMSSLPAPPVQSPHAYQSRFAPYGPVMSNLHNPGGQPIMVGGLGHHGMMAGFNSGHAASMQGMYGTPTPQPSQVADRPFKCDECPQSFNRNHDLKRHKRIHLAVKPFPCAHCDKSFSRKDALKRHVLVKGCGKALEEAEAAKQAGAAAAAADSSIIASPAAENAPAAESVDVKPIAAPQ